MNINKKKTVIERMNHRLDQTKEKICEVRQILSNYSLQGKQKKKIIKESYAYMNYGKTLRKRKKNQNLYSVKQNQKEKKGRKRKKAYSEK